MLQVSEAAASAGAVTFRQAEFCVLNYAHGMGFLQALGYEYDGRFGSSSLCEVVSGGARGLRHLGSFPGYL